MADGPDAPLKQGWLHRKGLKALKQWKECYFVLTKNRMLTAYYDESCSETSDKYRIDLQRATLDPMGSEKRKNGFSLTCDGVKLEMATDTEAQKLEWLELLKSAIEVSKVDRQKLSAFGIPGPKKREGNPSGTTAVQVVNCLDWGQKAPSAPKPFTVDASLSVEALQNAVLAALALPARPRDEVALRVKEDGSYLDTHEPLAKQWDEVRFKLTSVVLELWEHPSRRAQEFLRGLGSLDVESAEMKRLLFSMHQALEDGELAEYFIDHNGMRLLVNTISRASGNTLAYGVDALRTAMFYVSGMTYLFDSPDLVTTFFSFVSNGSVTVCRKTVELLLVLAEYDVQGFNLVYKAGVTYADRYAQAPFAPLTQLLLSPDFDARLNTLALLNSLLNGCPDKEALALLLSFLRINGTTLALRNMDPANYEHPDVQMQMERFENLSGLPIFPATLRLETQTKALTTRNKELALENQQYQFRMHEGMKRTQKLEEFIWKLQHDDGTPVPQLLVDASTTVNSHELEEARTRIQDLERTIAMLKSIATAAKRQLRASGVPPAASEVSDEARLLGATQGDVAELDAAIDKNVGPVTPAPGVVLTPLTTSAPGPAPAATGPATAPSVPARALPPPPPGTPKAPPGTPGTPPPPPGTPKAAVPKRAPRKAKVEPAVKMKGLFWNRILVFPEEGGEQTYWDAMDDVAVDKEELERVFAAKKVNEKFAASTELAKTASKQTVSVLTKERLTAVQIMKATLPPLPEVTQALLKLDTDTLSVDDVASLKQNIATGEELSKMLEVAAAGSEGLDACDMFLVGLSQVPLLDVRLRCWHFALTYKTECADLMAPIQAVEKAVDEVRSSRAIRTLFAHVLACGNYLNGGNAQRGQADGFELEILRSLDTTKGDSVSLLDYIVTKCRAAHPETQDIADRHKFLKEAARTDLATVQSLCEQMSRMLRDLTAKAKDLLGKPGEDDFTRIIGPVFTEAQERVATSVRVVQRASQGFAQLLAYLCVPPAKIKQMTVPEVFGMLAGFLEQFQDRWRQMQRAQDEEERAKRRAVTPGTPTSPTSRKKTGERIGTTADPVAEMAAALKSGMMQMRRPTLR